MQRICGPCELPGAEVRLTALFVQICEDEKQQYGNESGNDGRCNDNTVHRAFEDTCGRASRPSFGGKQYVDVFIPAHPNTTGFKYTPGVRFISETKGCTGSHRRSHGLTLRFAAPYHRVFLLLSCPIPSSLQPPANHACALLRRQRDFSTSAAPAPLFSTGCTPAGM